MTPSKLGTMVPHSIAVFVCWIAFAMFILTTMGCARGPVGSPGVAGIDGSDGRDGNDGIDGIDGRDGNDGTDGRDGRDGVDGRDGKDGRDGIDAVLEVIDPCGDDPNVLDEVLFRMTDGQIFAYFERGGNRYLTIIPPGSYQTTDGTKCNFKGTSDGRVQ